MAYLIDRERALLGREVVAVLDVRRRGVRSHVILMDNSLYRTLTRSSTIIGHLKRQPWLRAPRAAFTSGALTGTAKKHDGTHE